MCDGESPSFKHPVPPGPDVPTEAESLSRGLQRASFVARVVALPLIAMVRLYQIFGRPFLGWACRFHPTCSDYALEALRRHGAFRGGWLTLRRLGRCHPWGGSGEDPVP